MSLTDCTVLNCEENCNGCTECGAPPHKINTECSACTGCLRQSQKYYEIQKEKEKTEEKKKEVTKLIWDVNYFVPAVGYKQAYCIELGKQTRKAADKLGMALSKDPDYEVLINCQPENANDLTTVQILCKNVIDIPKEKVLWSVINLIMGSL